MIDPFLERNLADIRRAQDRLAGVARETPVQPSRTLSALAGANVYLKLENLQRTGSFKIRGAFAKIAKIAAKDKSVLRHGVVAASAGNHAQGVALGAESAGVRATIVMAEGSPASKVEATRRYGAHVVLHGANFAEAYKYALQYSQREGAYFVHPFDDLEVIHGQGTVGLELVKQLEQLDAVLVPVGGGGLLAGIALAFKALRPDVRVIGVQSATMDPFVKSMKAKRYRTCDAGFTIAEGIAVRHPGKVTWEIVRKYADEVVSVSDEAIARSVHLLLERAKIVAEGAGAAPVAALLEGHVRGVKDRTVCCVISGGNVDVCVAQEPRAADGGPSKIQLVVRVAPTKKG